MDYKQILTLIKAKDQKGLEGLYMLYADKFFGYAVNKWFFSEDDAMNVVYQTLETLVLKISSYEIESKAHFENFIYKVFINFLRQQFRKNRKRGKEILFASLQEIEVESESIDLDKIDVFFSNESFAEYYQTDQVENPKLIILQKALAELEKSDKEILLLRAQNFSYDEIAVMLKIENNQLKVKHHRAKARLLKKIEQFNK